MTAENQLFIHIPRLHTAIAEWLFCVVFIILMRKRFKWPIQILLMALWLGVFVGYHELAGRMPLGFWIPFMIGAVVLMFLFVFTMTKNNLFLIALIAFQSFIVAEFAASLEWQMYYYYFMNVNLRYPQILEYGIMITIYALTFAIILMMELRHKARKIKTFTTKTDFLIAFIITALVFAMSNLSFTGISSPVSGRYPQDIFYIRTLIDMLGIVLFYAIREYKLATYTRLELLALENVLNKQYSQYLQFKEAIEVVDRKYHDLKHQIAVLRSESEEVREKYLKELEQEIYLYEYKYKTGSKVLNILLSSKAHQISDNDINFTVVADGSSIDFISVMDVCSIIGNALDNAIEGVKNIQNKEERVIKLAIFQQQSFVLIKIENYYASELIFDGENFLTTKKDKRLHGYGIKSIRTIADQYNGTIDIKTEKNWFILTILIPIPKNIE